MYWFIFSLMAQGTLLPRTNPGQSCTIIITTSSVANRRSTGVSPLHTERGIAWNPASFLNETSLESRTGEPSRWWGTPVMLMGAWTVILGDLKYSCYELVYIHSMNHPDNSMNMNNRIAQPACTKQLVPTPLKSPNAHWIIRI